MRISDAKLVELILVGEEHYFNTLLERYKDAVFGVALSRLGSRDDALDVVQESFIRAYQKLDQLLNPGKFASWLLSITRNLCVSRTKWKQSYEKLHTEYLDKSSEYVGQKEELKVTLREALMGLSENNRETTILYYINGYSVKEISKFLEVPVGTVVRRLHDSRNKMREVIRMVKKNLEKATPKGEFVKKVSEVSIYPRVEPEIGIQRLTPERITIDFLEITWSMVPIKCGARVSFGFYDYPERRFTGYQVAGAEKRKVDFHGRKAYVIRSPGYTEREEFEGESVFYCGIEAGNKVYLGRKVYDTSGKLEISESFKDKEWDGAEVKPEPMKLSTTNYWKWTSPTRCNTHGKDKDCDGPWEVKIGDKSYRCLRVIEFTPTSRAYNHKSNVGVEGFIDIATGRTIFFRRYNGSSWTKEKVGKKWPRGTIESLKGCPRIVCDGEAFYLWYDCIPDHVLR